MITTLDRAPGSTTEVISSVDLSTTALIHHQAHVGRTEPQRVGVAPVKLRRRLPWVVRGYRPLPDVAAR